MNSTGFISILIDFQSKFSGSINEFSEIPLEYFVKYDKKFYPKKIEEGRAAFKLLVEGIQKYVFKSKNSSENILDIFLNIIEDSKKKYN